MIDQRVSEGDKINFFKRPALTTTLPAQLSIKFNLDIIPVFIYRNENNIFNIRFLERIKPNSSVNKIKMTEELNKVLESMIFRNLINGSGHIIGGNENCFLPLYLSFTSIGEK